MVGVQQLEALVDFVEANPELVLGRCSRSAEGRSLAKRLWAECAETLNSVSPNCVVKTADGWRLYFNDFKSKVLKKIKQAKGEHSATGGGPAQNISLTPLQERLFNILGRDVGEPLPGVRYNPISHQNLPNFAVEAEEGPGPQNYDFIQIQPSAIFETEGAEDECPIIIEAPEPSIPRPERPRPPPRPERAASASPALPQPRRRRRRRHSACHASDEPSMREASTRLADMERLSADATIIHARATERVAAAIDRLCDRLNEPITINVIYSPPARRRFRRVISSSDDE